MKLSENESAVYRCIARNNTTNQKQIASELKLHPRSIRNITRKLEQKQLIKIMREEDRYREVRYCLNGLFL